MLVGVQVAGDDAGPVSLTGSENALFKCRTVTKADESDGSRAASLAIA